MKEKSRTKKISFLISYFILISLIFSITATYAWFSAVLTRIDGNLGIGNMSATAYLYENFDDSDSADDFVDGLTDAKIVQSNGTNMTAFNMIEKSWYSNVYTSIYLEVENTGTIDFKSILKIAYDNENITTFLSYYYYQVVDITQNVNSFLEETNREKLSEYNYAYQADIESNINTYINNILQNGHSITSNLTTINMGTTKVEESSFFRLDIAVSEMPTELLTQYNALSPQEREIKINSTITIKQVNAPDDDSQESGTSLYVSSADAFISAVYGASNGDSIYLSNNIVISRNITITRRINIFLNGFSLSVFGNFAYDVAVAGSITLDVSNNSLLSVSGDLIVDAPNATFRLLGSGGTQAIVLGNIDNPNSGRFYVNSLLDDNNTATYGYYQYGLAVVKRTPEGEEPATLTVDSNTRVSIGLSSKIGPIISANGASNIQVYNYGEIEKINFSSMSMLQTNKIQINIYNRNKFLAQPIQVTLPAWSIGWLSKDIENHPSPINTVIRNEPGSVPITGVDGSPLFLNRDIQDGDMATDSVIHLGGNKYRINFQLDMYGNDTYRVSNYLYAYYTNLNNNATQTDYELWLETIEGLNLYTYSATSVKNDDFAFINTSLSALKSLDLSYAIVQGGIIPASAFYNKVTLQEILFPLSELSIQELAFYGTSISQVTLHSSIISIGAGAFDINTSLNGLLEVFYEGENVDSLINNISGFVENKTLLFMSSSNLESFKTNYLITDAWYINSYTTYNFVDNNQFYYRIIDGNSVEIVYYAGNWHTNLMLPNNVSNLTSSYRVVGISNSAFRRSINQAENTFVNISFPNNITAIKSDAFYSANIATLSLNNVSSIGSYAFAGATIQTSVARGETFSGMLSLGKYAFASSVIGTNASTLQAFESHNTENGKIKNVLELQGNYLPAEGIFDSAEFNGVKLNLSELTSITSNMTNNMSLYGSELNLNKVRNIGNSAFEARFKNYVQLISYNKITAQEVQNIGSLAFKEMHLNEFVIGIKTMYTNQLDVNININYGASAGGIFHSDFKAVNLVIDGLLPELSLQNATFIFGSASAGREYQNVTIKNTGGKLYDHIFYAPSNSYGISINNLHLHDINKIGDYALYYTTVNSVKFYSSNQQLSVSTITNVGKQSFRYSSVGQMGELSLLNVDEYAFADSVVPANKLTITGTVAEYAFSNANTTNISEISITGNLASYAFSQALLYTVEDIYLSASLGTSVFENSRIYNLESFVFDNMTVASNTFKDAIIFSTASITALGISHADPLAFYSLSAENTTLDMTNFLTIKHEALKQINIKELILGNTNFYNNYSSTYMYGTAQGGIFTEDQISNIDDMRVNGQLPSQRAGTQILGAKGADVHISNIYISAQVSRIPAYAFNSDNITNRLRVQNLYIASQNLIVEERAFAGIYVNNINYTGTTGGMSPGQISFVGTNAFYSASIGNFVNFVYYDSSQQKNQSVMPIINDYTFHYATFRQDSNLSLFENAVQLGNFAFKNANFAKTSQGQDISLNLSQVLTIGHSIFDSTYSLFNTITLGNQAYSQANLANYYYGNSLGSEGVFNSSSNFTLNNLIIAGNLPETNISSENPTKMLGISQSSNLTINNVTISSAVNKISAFAFSGASIGYKTNITNLTISSQNLLIEQSAFEYTDITYLTINGSNLSLGSKAFKHADLRNMIYNRSQGVGEIIFASGAVSTFESATLYSMTGFSAANSGVFKNIGKKAFLGTIFESGLEISWINHVESIGDNAFESANFKPSSSNQYVALDFTKVVSVGEQIFAFIVTKLGKLTLGNSSYGTLYGVDYSYGRGIDGMLYASGRIDELNIVGNLPTVNTYSMLGNSYDNINRLTNIGTINISQSVSSVPANSFISESKTTPLTVGILNINSTSISFEANAFKNATITTLNFLGQTTNLQESAFSGTTLTNVNIHSLETNLGQKAFENALITTLEYKGTTSGQLNMTGSHTFASAQITNIINFYGTWFQTNKFGSKGIK